MQEIREKLLCLNLNSVLESVAFKVEDGGI